MNESMLRSFLKIIACMAKYSRSEPIRLVRGYVEIFLERNFGRNLASSWILEFDRYYSDNEGCPDSSSYLKEICNSINREYTLSQKYFLLVSILNFLSSSHNQQLTAEGHEHDTLAKIASWLNIGTDDFLSCKYFAQGMPHRIPKEVNLLVVASKDPKFSNIRFMQSEGLKGVLLFLFIPKANLLLFHYNGSSYLEINARPLYTKHVYTLTAGSVLNGKGVAPMYYGQIIRAILHRKPDQQVHLTAEDISFSYAREIKGVSNLSLSVASGDLVGVMGGSGTGKSTLIKLLSGNLIPDKGRVMVNGRDISTMKDSYRSIVGIMHQEECLVEELSVYENLYYSTRLALGNASSEEIRGIVEQKLADLDLTDCKDNIVGSPGNRQLSGGQRKRLSIAMEITREPAILFVDEPTSGLSSSDSEAVINILKGIALSGTLVIVNIHQPSSNIFKQFDKLLILDKGGVPVYLGNPIEAILHFKDIADRVDKSHSGCNRCGTIQPELIFEIIEEQGVDKFGGRLNQRKVTPEQWSSLSKSGMPDEQSEQKELPLPKAQTPLADVLLQFATYFSRNGLAKLRNREFMFLALFLPIALAAMVSLFLRYAMAIDIDAMGYTLYANPNLASFFLMCILASLFFGLTLSCEDIFRDKQLIVRERFMGLNIRSYYNAKVAFLLLISAYQALAFTFIGAAIIELKGMYLELWLMLYIISVFGNLVGLIISSALRSVVAIYILVPFLLIPQILLSGLVVRFDNLNQNLSSQDVVPPVGETMVSRWSSEALLVHYYTNNRYNKPLFEQNMRESQIRFRILHLIPVLQQHIPQRPFTDSSLKNINWELIANGIDMLSRAVSISPPEVPEGSSPEQLAELLNEYIAQARSELSALYSDVNRQKDVAILSIAPNTPDGRQELINLRNTYHNRATDDLVRNRHYPNALVIDDDKFIQKVDPIFHVASSPVGRSHYLAPYKQFAGSLVKTYWYNLTMMILMVITMYLLLLSDVFSTSSKLRSATAFKFLSGSSNK